MKEIFQVFVKLGFIAFGGPAAHLAMMEQEIVEKRKWMDRQLFLDLMGATNLIPGPNSTEMTMHCGYVRGGWKGLIVAGASFILPAVLLTGLLAYFYVNYGDIPQIAPFFLGIKPAVLSIILLAIIKLGKKALKNWQIGLIGLVVVALSIAGMGEVLAILIGGAIGLLWFGAKHLKPQANSLAFPIILQTVITAGSWSVFKVFLKVGAVLFGSGYVLVAYLQGELVDKLGWITESQLLDAIAMGQFTPGPVLSTATFVGFQINGFSGAVAATLGIFLPSFFFAFILNIFIEKIRKSKLARAFLDGVNISAVAIMAVVLIELGAAVLIDWKSWLIALLSITVALSIKKVSSVYIVLGGMILGYLLYLI